MPIVKRPLRAYPRNTRELGKTLRALDVSVSGSELNITDADIPATIARDSEVSASIAAEVIARNTAISASMTAHEAAADPHPGYLTAAELTAVLAGAIHLTGIISPNILTGNVDDYNPTGLSTAQVLRLSSDASRDITGIVAQSSGRVLELFNVGGFDIVLRNDTTSANVNRFLFGADITLETQEGIRIWYDSLSGRWRSSGKHV